MTEKDVKSLALFFFFITLDDRRALQLASTASDVLSAHLNKHPETKNSVAVVMAAQSVWEKFRSRWTRGRPHFSKDAGWIVPENVDLSGWKEFQKSAPEEEFIALIWSKIVLIPDSDISMALGITQGTIRYRVGRALKKLGSVAEVSST
jgi:hypothetical protein